MANMYREPGTTALLLLSLRLAGYCSKTMKAKLLSAWGYQGDNMNLPVADVDSAAGYYVKHMGFEIVETGDEPHKKVVLAREAVQMALAENGGDPEQDGCAFRTDNVVALREEFIANGLSKIGPIDDETRGDGSKYKVFFVVAPDGLCFWFGELVPDGSDA